MKDVVERLRRYAGSCCISTSAEMEAEQLKAELEALKRSATDDTALLRQCLESLEDEARGDEDVPAVVALHQRLGEVNCQRDTLNLSDHAVQKRLAAQWGYAPADDSPSGLVHQRCRT